MSRDSEVRDAERSVALRVLAVLPRMYEFADKGDSWPGMIDTARYVIETDGLDALERRVAKQESDDDDWSCIDCGIPLEPGAPPICEECVDG